MAAPTIADVYPPTPPLHTHALPVSGGHVLHVDEFGTADGIPALVLHGGPGSGCSPLLRRFFDPLRYRIICADQRGAGASRPRGETAHNTTAHLLDDLRTLRAQLGIERWLVVGGSWGATLAIAHAAEAPQAVTGVLLRATFLARTSDVAAFFDAAPLSLAQAVDTFATGDATACTALARTWWRHEQAMASAAPAEPPEPAAALLPALVDRYRVQAHYLQHDFWLAPPFGPPLLDRCAALPPVPTLLLHGTVDRVCPPDGARFVAARLPHARLQWIAGAGHDPSHPAMAAAMVAALDGFADNGDFDVAATR